MINCKAHGPYELTQECPKCAKTRTTKWHKNNIERHRELNRAWKANNKDKVKEQARRATEARYQYLQNLKSTTACHDCNTIYDHWIMEFDHRDDTQKTANVSTLASTSWVKMYAEIEKCDIVCANCHKTRTYLRRQSSSSPYSDSPVTLPPRP